ncbi:MAG: endonuclease Q family protein [bacterium]|nr:endonuclease Q family protein [bacterium]
MRYIADFHIHSKYSRATSREMDLEHISEWAKIKGIQIVGTGDFTHPEWLEEIKNKLEPAEAGLFKFKNSSSAIRFILTTEISCIYSKGNKVRKIHLVFFAPNLESVEKFNTQLGWTGGNLKSDGRPILGMDVKELVKIALDISKDFFIVPAHIWTPWFSVFGSKSGFNSIEECFEEYTNNIFALETGLSSDPAMNWMVSGLDKYTLISNSDAHSPAKLGREANIFEGSEIDYFKIIEAIKQGGKENELPLKMKATIEFFPEEGKYHYDGHRVCDVCLAPKETKKYNGICPKCGRPLTVGVLYRVGELADRDEGFKPKNSLPFYNLVPLQEIIADSLNLTTVSQKVKNEYDNLIKNFDNEFNVLLDVSEQNLMEKIDLRIAKGIINVRQGKVGKEPGYDGVFGKIRVSPNGNIEKKKQKKQESLF